MTQTAVPEAAHIEPASLACLDFQADLAHHLKWLKANATDITRRSQIEILLHQLKRAL